MDTQKFTEKRRPRRTHPTLAADKPPTLRDDVREYLDDLVRTLQLMMCVVIASTKALREQNADADADIALVLQHYCSDQLDVAIDKARALLGRAAFTRIEGTPQPS